MLLTLDWNPRALPAGTQVENVPLRTADGAATGGALYAKGNSRTAVFLMHPREFFAFHYLVPSIVEAGFAAWAQLPRSVGLDLRLEHEIALFDVASGMKFLKERGFDHVVFLGNSGGSGLFSLYVQQAALEASKRISRTPAGRATGLAELDMPNADAMVYLAPHPGQGRLLMGCIDPSVTDELDPLSVDPALDAFSVEGGRFDTAFIEKYRKAQVERVRRLDEKARALVARRQEARKNKGDRRLAAHTPIMTVWRTDADLRCLDLSIDPSDRKPGSVWGKDVFASNYGSVGFARNCTPESWLSSWSGLSSNAALEKTAPAVVMPTLLVEYTGDQTTFPQTVREIFGWIGTSDKKHLRIRGDHHGRPLAQDEEPGRDIAGRAIGEWLQERFG
jgi:hypothetical protein